jgi:4,5-dihydroxyphthalate decarboxylase
LTRPRITAAVGDFDRTRPLLDGRVEVPGFDVGWTSGALESLFSRAFGTAEFDVTELSFCNYLIATAGGGSPYAGLPIFPTRVFRHHAIFIRTDRGIRTPRDLEGRAVGLREYTNTAALVARGVLAEQYGVDLAKVRWRVGDVDVRERDTIKLPALPPPYDIAVETRGLLSDLLARGDLDALIAYQPPRCHGQPGVGRLFPRWREEEQRYFADTGVFPIMHLMVAKRTTLERYPALGSALFDAFCQAKALVFRELAIEQAPKVSLPWTAAHLAETQRVLGANFYAYGLEACRKTLEAQIRFARTQHLVARDVAVEELFAPALHGMIDTMERNTQP